MKKPIKSIVVEETSRIRKDTGDLVALEASIRRVGLLNPIVVDERGRLVAGYRRLMVCRNLGWSEIEVSVVNCDGDILKMLEVEADENLYRKDFTPDEIIAIEKRREEIRIQRRGTLLQRFWRWLRGLFAGPADAGGTKDLGKK